MGAPKVSVIVPVYNCENYIARCIQSLLAQTLHEIEIIAIDDGSTDKSGAILDRYAEEDQRLRVFHQENGGVAAARNKGLQYAQGTYIGFVDGDDYVEPNMYEELFVAVDGRADMAICGYDLQFMDRTVPRLPAQKASFVNITQPADFFIEYFWKSPNLWDKIYHRELIQNYKLSFSGDIGEDLLFNLRLLLYLNSAGIVNKVLYHYVQRKGSIIHKKCLTDLDHGDLLENYLIGFAKELSKTTEGSSLFCIFLLSVLTGYLCSAKTSTIPLGGLREHILKLLKETQLCDICSKAMQGDYLYQLVKTETINPIFYRVEKWLLFLLNHRLVGLSSILIWVVSRLYVKSHLEDETVLFP